MDLHERLLAVAFVAMATWPMQLLSADDTIPLLVKQSMAAGRTSEVLPWLVQAAKEGNATAALYLGKLYLTGTGVSKDDATARRYLQQGASAGLDEAQLMLGHLARDTGDLHVARGWFEKAAASGNPRAVAWLAANPKDKNVTAFDDVFHRIEAGKADLTGLGDMEFNRRDATGATPLIRAVQQKSSEWVMALLARPADVSAVDHAGNSALHYAAAEDSSGILSVLLQAGASVNLKNKLGSTPIHQAVSHKRLSNVELLVTHGADLGSTDANGWTPVMLAERLELKTSFANLEKRMPERLDSSQVDSATDVLRAIRAGNLDVLHQLIGQGVALNIHDANGDSPLHIAIMEKHATLIGPLIAAGAEVNSANARGLTALMVAAQVADATSLAALLAAGADWQLADTRGQVALHHAVLSRCTACLNVLIESGADVTRQDRSGVTPLLLALRKSPELGSTLLGISGAALHLRDKNGRDALWVAAAAGSDSLVNALLDAGLVMHADNEGVSPLHTVARIGRVDLAARLLKTPTAADFMSARTTAGNTPLMLASYHDSAGIVRLLLDAGARVEEQNAAGDTALHLAARRGSYQAALFLVESGASFNQRNTVGQSARSIIEATNDPRWLELLTMGAFDMQRLLQRITQK